MAAWWMWSLFFVFVAAALAVDFFVFKGRRAHEVSIKEAILWTCAWISLAILFNVVLWYYLTYVVQSPLANDKSLEFFTAYVLEKMLSVDNIFVFIAIFQYFAIPSRYQKRILLFGVMSAIILRLIFILFGIYLVNQFYWILYIFGVFLVITGIKLFSVSDHGPNIGKNPVLKWMQKHIKITERIDDEKFFIRINGARYATPLFLSLILIEISDIIFAVDSIPAVFAVTRDSFIVFTSNVFAILGLRALYFLLAPMVKRFRLLKYGIAVILVFIGLKMLVAHWIQIPVILALAVIVIVILLFVLMSLYRWQKK